MEQRWGFLVPWCDVLSGRIFYRRHGCAGTIGIPELQVGDMLPCNLQVGLPSRSEMKAEEMTLHYDPKRKVDLKAALQYVQEALALLVAVKHVDYAAWGYLLLKHCHLDVGREGEEEFEAELPARFELYTDLDRDKASNSNLVHFCGVYQREHRSAAYLKTLARIAALDDRLGKDKPGVDINIPVRIIFSPGLAHIARCAGGDLKVLMDIRTAERTIRKQWKAYSDDDVLSPGALRCTFELSPMVADFDEWAVTSKTTEAMESLALGDVWFSQLSLAAELGPELEKDELQSRKTLGKLMTRVLNLGNRSRERSLGALGLFINAALKPGDFEAMCSAIALNQMTKNLSLGMWMDTHRWKWLAYSLFSKRARACSALQSLALLSIHNMRIAEMKEFAAILASEYPEEELFDCPRGAVEGREATLKRGAPIRWQFHDKGEAALTARAMVLDSSIPSVRTFSDDGESAWVNVLVPGYGRCQVQRGDLEFQEDNQDQSTQTTELTSLTLGFSACCAGTSSGLPVFLRAVGSTLKRLTLNGPRVDIDENWILESCPNIEELSTCGGLVDARLNFCGYRASNEPFPELNCYWDDVAALASDLQDPSNPLSNCVHRLRVRLNFIDGARRLKAAAKALLQMLRRNKSLEFLEVVVQPKYDGYFAEFRRHHRQPIGRALKPLPREGKAAFISVLSRQQATKTQEELRKPGIGQLNHVVKNIFAFAADPVLREVYFRRSEEAENEVKWDEVTI